MALPRDATPTEASAGLDSLAFLNALMSGASSASTRGDTGVTSTLPASSIPLPPTIWGATLNPLNPVYNQLYPDQFYEPNYVPSYNGPAIQMSPGYDQSWPQVASNDPSFAPGPSGGGTTEARQAAESYLGRSMSDTEYDQLVRATYAEADPGSQAEAAMVAASILNRTRDSGGTVTSTLMAPYQFESVTGTNGRAYTPSRNFSEGPPASSRQFIEGSMTGILPNVSHKQTDFTAASPAAYAGPGHDLAYFHQAQQNYHQVGGSLFNTDLPSGKATSPTQTASATLPPLPNLRPGDVPSSSFPTNDFGAAPQLPQLASYNTSAPAGPQQPFVDDLGGNGTASPLHQFKVYEPSDVSAGPYGADALVKAAMSGDVTAFNKAMGDLTGAAAKDALTPAFLGGIGMDGVQKKLQGYFDQLQQQSPGAVRAMQTAYSSNPQLAAAVPPQLQSALQDAFKALPAQSTGQVPLPNMRPSTIPQASTPPPLPPAPSGPTMVSQTSTTSLPPKDDPRFPPGWSPGQPLPNDAGDAGSWPDNAATNFTQPNYWTPSTLNPSQLSAMDGGGGSTVANPPQWKPTVATPPPMPSFNYQPYINSGQIQFSNYGQGGPQQPFFGVPQSQFQSTFNSMVPPPLPLGMPNFGQSAAPKPPASAAPPLPRAQSMPPPTPQPMTPQQAFMQQAGPAPQNVNWQATLAPDPDAQPGTDNSYVLNDLGYGGGELGGPGFNAFVYG